MLKTIERFVTGIMEYIGMTLLVLMTMVTCYAVFTRYFLAFSPGWAEETALTCMVWFGFLAMAIGVSEDLHIGITILDMYMSEQTKHCMDIFKYVAIAAFSVILVSEGWTMTEIGMDNIMPGLGLPSGVLYAVIPLAGLAMIAYSLVAIIRLFETRKKGAAQ